MSSEPARRGASANWPATVLAAALFGLAGLSTAALAGLEIAALDGWARGRVTWLALFAGVALCGGIAWRRLAGRDRSGAPLSGATAGVLAAIAAYPTVAVLVELGHTASVGPAGFAYRLLRAIQVAGLLLVTTGLLAVVVLGLLGALLAWLLRIGREPGATGGGRLTRRWPIAGAALVLILAAAFAVLSTMSPRFGQIDRLPAPAPAASYDAALAAIAAIAAAEAREPLEPRCLSRLLTHGAKTAVAVVYLHGVTTCPAQADVLAQQLFDAGYNVYLPRFPGHGEADRFTEALVDVSAEDLVRTADEAADIAHGLGDRVVVAGLSGGATAAMWLAQSRGDLARTVSMAPFISPYVIPLWANRAAMNLLMLLPNTMVLWDPDDVEPVPGMEYAYPQMPSRMVAQFLRLGELLKERAARAAPLSKATGLLLNDADDTVNNAPTEAIAADWAAHGASLDLRRIPAARQALHDLIDPRQPGAQIGYTYPIVIDMIAGRAGRQP